MRIPGVRITTQRTMVLVAVVAAATAWGIDQRRMSKEYLKISRFHANEAAGQNMLFGGDPVREKYHDDLAEKYQLAARFPFIPIPVDPPGPPRTRVFRQGTVDGYGD